MKKLLLLLLLVFQISTMFPQLSSPTCITATPICGNTLNSYPSTSGGAWAQAGPDYGCLISQPNPSWFYFKIDNPGNLSINITQTDPSGTGTDVDFICWGPFSSPSAACSGLLTSGTVKDCSYSTMFNETVDVAGAANGEYYMLMITNYANIPGNISFSVDSGSTATIDCQETCVTHPDYIAPACVNSTLQLLSTYHFGVGTYFWTGPNGFTSSLQHPVIPGITAAGSGYYYVNYTRDSTCNYTDSVYVQVDTCGTLTGMVYGDNNSNCSYESPEAPVSHAQLKLSQAGTFVAFAWTDAFGFYSFDALPGTYTIEVVPNPAYPVSCSSSMAHSVTIVPSTILTENFAVDCNMLDLAAINIVAGGIPFFPGASHTMYPVTTTLGAHCNTSPIPGQMIMILDPLVHYTAPASPPPTAVIPAATGDTLIWNIADVTALAYTYMSTAVQYTTDIAATIGDTVHITLIIQPGTTDVNPANNTYHRYFVVGNSYDPNGKEVVPAGVGPQGFIPASTSHLEYTINFQNTGTAPAHNIYVLDTLDADLDVTSLQIIGSSHAQTTSFLPGNVIKFNFSNIMLPDSGNYEAQSHGFVKYSISPNAGLSPGTQITNTAYIYFDFNSPIVTNTALNTVEFPTGIVENANDQLAVFPNPTNGSATILFEDKQSRQLNLKIMNISGQVVYEENANGFGGKYSKTVDLSNCAKGIYLLQISTEKQVLHQKLIKQ